jgi:uncharacterized phiE125 gp8 family phage protein
MTRKLVTGPTSEPVTLTEAKAQTRVDGTDDDTFLTRLIQVARETVEMIARRALFTQTWDLVLDDWPDDDEIVIPLPPLQSITSITYVDEDGTTTTLDTSTYVVDTYREPGLVLLASGASWPAVTLAESSAIRVRFVAGWDDVDEIPQRYKQAALLLIGHLYEHREAVSEVRNLNALPLGVEALLWLDRVF